MTARNITRWVVALAVVMPFFQPTAHGCTSAIVDGGITANGHMLLWKHRDSGCTDSFVARVERRRVDNVAPISGVDSTLAFVGLFNVGDKSLREVWAGMNEAGFGIMNTASYNLVPDTAEIKDREGLVMAEALGICRSAADFLKLLDTKMASGCPLGVQANFGVIDSEGNGIYVEACDHGYEVYSLSDAADGFMVRSNYSYSGGQIGRLGEVRHDNAVALLRQPAERRSITPLTFTDGLSKSFYHASEGRDMLERASGWLVDAGEFIPRRSSSASVVIEGGCGGEPPVMWIAIGFPVLSETVRVELDDIPEGLLPDGENGHSKLSDEANQRRDMVLKRRGGKYMFDVELLKKLMGNERYVCNHSIACRE